MVTVTGKYDTLENKNTAKAINFHHTMLNLTIKKFYLKYDLGTDQIETTGFSIFLLYNNINLVTSRT